MKSLRTSKKRHGFKTPCSTTLARARRAAGLTRPITEWLPGSPLPPSRGRPVAGCPGVKSQPWVLRSIATYVKPWPARGRLVTWVSQARTTQAGAAPVLGRDGMCPQPPRSARGEDQRSLFRHCAGQGAGCARPEPTQTARRHAGWVCVWGMWGGGERDVGRGER